MLYLWRCSEHVSSLLELLDVSVSQVSYDNRIYLFTLAAVLHDSSFFDKSSLKDFGINDFRSHVLSELSVVSYEFYEIGDEFYSALSLFSLSTRERAIKEESELIVLENGQEKSVLMTLPEHRRELYSSGMSVATTRSLLSLDQSSTFFILRNCIDGLLKGFEFQYSTSSEDINREIQKINRLLFGTLGATIGVPSLVFLLIGLHLLVIRAKMQKFLCGIYNLGPQEALMVVERIRSSKRVFEEEKEENSLRKELWEFSGLLLRKEEGESQKNQPNDKGGMNKENRFSSLTRHRQMASLNKKIFFRFGVVFFVLLATLVILGVLSLIFYYFDSKMVSEVSQGSVFKEELTTFFLFESQFYSEVMCLIGTNGTGIVLGRSIEEAILEQIQSTKHVDFIDGYLVYADEYKTSSFFFKILDQVENNNICETILKEDPLCSSYFNGVFTEGMSNIIQYMNSGFRSTINEFYESDRSEKSIKSILTSSFLKGALYLYDHASLPIYSWLFSAFDDDLTSLIAGFGPRHNALSVVFGILLCVVVFLSLWATHKFIWLDENQIKEVFRLLSPSIYQKNKYMSQFLASSSPVSLRKFGQRVFE